LVKELRGTDKKFAPTQLELKEASKELTHIFEKSIGFIVSPAYPFVGPEILVEGG
jgi:hypothetical protein